jgi:serine protease AprX
MPLRSLLSDSASFARELVDLILLGPTGDRRQLQDSPLLGDVWLAFARDPKRRMDLLITPYHDHAAGPVAMALANALRQLAQSQQMTKRGLATYLKDISVAYLQGLVAARLSFEELLTIVGPRTFWWKDRDVQKSLLKSAAEQRLLLCLERLRKWARAKEREEREKLEKEFANLSSQDRYIALAGIILWQAEASVSDEKGLNQLADLPAKSVAARLQRLLFAIKDAKIPVKEQGTIWQVSLNRTAVPALQRSIPAVKGDAARTLFKVNCENIRWAVLDSGIDGGHPAFRSYPAKGKKTAQSRIIEAYDFRNIRQIVNLDNANIQDRPGRLKDLLADRKLDKKRAIKNLQQLAEDAGNDRPILWELVKDFIKIDPTSEPTGSHGTHVAGIIGASGENGEADGMCPDIKLLDFRVLSKTLEDTEFAIIAALQFIRYLNERSGYIAVHGANLSLSISHDVRNFACGRTPICNECERLVNNGVVVVAAAGNRGYQSFETHEGAFESYAAFSITDPGNADGVLTVGATHRYRPHTYGVSFFSSRGPTGDGRLKPDIVAPGERIRSCMPGSEWGELDGTSMAAPHVSGAAAMLLARYSELIGQPREIKRILCETATDLGREHSFQGNGMLDVLRAFQKI